MNFFNFNTNYLASNVKTIESFANDALEAKTSHKVKISSVNLPSKYLNILVDKVLQLKEEDKEFILNEVELHNIANVCLLRLFKCNILRITDHNILRFAI